MALTWRDMAFLGPALAVAFMMAGTGAAGGEEQTARGYVFEDLNANGVRDPGEPGVPGVGVSNGVDVVTTDDRGRYEIPVEDDTILFVIKPRDYMTPVSEDQIPAFYYIHKPDGAPALHYPGVEPTGDLPGRVNFPLRARPEPERFRAVVFGDPQPRNMEEVEYIARDVVDGLIGVDAAFGVTLGDIVFDDLDLFEPLNAVIGHIGIPWRNILGNHDINFDASNHRHATETFQRVYGPPYYAFAHGPVFFLMLDNVHWQGDGHVSRLGADQLRFIENALTLVDPDQLVVMFMHHPITSTEDREELFALLEDFPNTVSVSAQWHRMSHKFLGPEDGWPGERPHHHIVHGTVSGSWWAGHPDELGVPHATMSDGTPNGYSIFTFDGANYSFEYFAARRPEDYQMNIHAPDEVSRSEAGETAVVANVFAGSSRSVVEMRLGGAGPWRALERVERPDPNYERLKEVEQAVIEAFEEAETDPPAELGRTLPSPRDSTHIWEGTLPDMPEAGTHLIEIRATDMFNQVYNGHRVIRVTED